jgi:hypothetical protein
MTVRKQEWCTRKDLNLHAARAAASEAAASAVSPRVRCRKSYRWCRNGGSNAGFRLTKAAPCQWKIAAADKWCWLEDSNLPPLAYEAGALPDELSQHLGNGQKRDAAPLPEWKRPCGCARLGAASKSGRSQCQRARRQRRRRHRRTASCRDRAQRCACAVGTRDELGWTSVDSVGHLPSCLSGGGRALRRLFRFQSRALLGPHIRARDARIAERAHRQPITRTVEPSGGGAGRGGDM